MPATPVRLYLDEDVSLLIGEMLRARGFDILSTRDAGNLGSGDLEQLQFAVREGRILLTHNRRDFERLVSHYLKYNLNTRV